MNHAGIQSNNTVGFPDDVVVPEGLVVVRVLMDDPYMQDALRLAIENKFEEMTVTASVVVKDGVAIGKGTNGDGWHQKHGRCERTGQENIGKRYEDCPGCHPENHSERVAIREAKEAGHDMNGADLYMYGHWWSCEPCMRASRDAGIARIFLLADSKPLFDRNHPKQKENRKDFETLWAQKLNIK
jgi:deoxycytidylate deaminase